MPTPRVRRARGVDLRTRPVVSSGPSDSVERVRAANDIVDVISSYVPLKRSGRSFKACCPFHDEKTPSFHVTPDRQIFKCFGCGVGGSVFDFVMRAEKMTFGEALRHLAEKAGIELEPERPGVQEKRNMRREQLRAMDWAARVFRRNLGRPEGEACRAYLEKRGIAQSMIDAFGLGYAPAGWRNLLQLAYDKSVPVDLLESTGLVLRSRERNGLYDAFRDRLMFPIRNAQGDVIAFGGRCLDGSEPKYLNSPETELFQKRLTVYGVERLRELKRDEPVLVMEGYTDVIMATQVGVRGAVATLGTSLTQDHVRLLARYAERVILVYDGDRAGNAATVRAIPLLLGRGLDLRVVLLPGGQDPCDFFLERGAQGIDDLLPHTRELGDYLIAQTCGTFDLATLDGKRRAAAFLGELCALVDDTVTREALLARGAQAIGVQLGTLAAVIAKARKPQGAAAGTRPPESAPRPAGEVRGMLPGRGGSTPARRRAFDDIMDCCFNAPSIVSEAAGRLTPDHFLPDEAQVRDLVLGVLSAIDMDPQIPAVQLLCTIANPETRSWAAGLLREADPTLLRDQLEGALFYLENGRLEREIETLAEQAMFADSDDALRRLSEAKLMAEQLRRKRTRLSPGGPA